MNVTGWALAAVEAALVVGFFCLTYSVVNAWRLIRRLRAEEERHRRGKPRSRSGGQSTAP
jgi:hypothetical protein